MIPLRDVPRASIRAMVEEIPKIVEERQRELESTDDVVYLVSKKNQYKIPRKAALVSPALKVMLEGPFKEHEDRMIELKDMEDDVVAKISEYLTYRWLYDGVEDFEIPEFEIPTELSLELLIAADYLNI